MIFLAKKTNFANADYKLLKQHHNRLKLWTSLKKGPANQQND
jgi:hypothetical protein